MEPAVCPYVHYSTSLQVYWRTQHYTKSTSLLDVIEISLQIYPFSSYVRPHFDLKKNITIMVYISSQNININVVLKQLFQLYVCTVFKNTFKINYFSFLSVVWYKQIICSQCLRYCLRFFKSLLSTLWVRTRFTYSHLKVSLFITI